MPDIQEKKLRTTYAIMLTTIKSARNTLCYTLYN